MAFWKRRVDSRDLNDTLRDRSLTVQQKLTRLREQRTAIEEQLDQRHAFHVAFLGRWRDRRRIRANNRRIAKEMEAVALERVEEMARRIEELARCAEDIHSETVAVCPPVERDYLHRPNYPPDSALAILRNRGMLKMYG